MLDSWERHERGYYPREALDFDISRHAAQTLEESLKMEANFAFVADEGKTILGVALGRRFEESGFGSIEVDRRSPQSSRARDWAGSVEESCHQLQRQRLP